MAARMTSSACSSGVIDIVCGTLQAELFTKDLSSGSSHCIQYGSLLLSPYEFQCQAGKAAARNWKNSIQPLSRVLDSLVAPDGKRRCRFVASTLVNLPVVGSPNSQPPDSPALDTGLADASEVSQPQKTSASTSPRAHVSPPDHVRLPDYHPITPPHFHWGPIDSEAFSLSLDAAYLTG